MARPLGQIRMFSNSQGIESGWVEKMLETSRVGSDQVVSLLGLGTVLRLERGCEVNGQITKASSK